MSSRLELIDRWQGQETRLSLIINAIKSKSDDWNRYLKSFMHAGHSFPPLPFIDEVDLLNYVDLRGADLSGSDFSGCYIRGRLDYTTLHNVNFANCIAQSDFTGAHILSCNFNKCNLLGAKFEMCVISSSDFSNADLSYSSFGSAVVRYSKFVGTNLDSCNFVKTRFRKVDMRAAIISTDTNFGLAEDWQLFEPRNDVIEDERNVRIGEYDFYDYSDKAEVYKDIEKFYLSLKLAAKSAGLYSLGGRFHFRERKCHRLARKKVWSRGYIWEFIQEKLVGYGEKPFRTFIAAAIIIVASSLAFLFSGFEYQTSTSLRIVNRDLKFDPSQLSGTIADWVKSLYLSTITFTTVGYGDTRPLGQSAVIASIEALLGLVLMAMFVTTLARVTIRD